MKASDESNRQLAIDGYLLLNQAIADLAIVRNTLRFFDELTVTGRFLKLETKRGVVRMVLCHTGVTLWKVREILAEYARVIPRPNAEVARALRKDLDKRGVKNFRDTYAAHIHDKRTGRPLTVEDLERAIESLANGTSVENFLDWVHEPNSVRRDTVVAVLEALRSGLQQEWGFKDEELFPDGQT